MVLADEAPGSGYAAEVRGAEVMESVVAEIAQAAAAAAAVVVVVAEAVRSVETLAA